MKKLLALLLTAGLLGVTIGCPSTPTSKPKVTKPEPTKKDSEPTKKANGAVAEKGAIKLTADPAKVEVEKGKTAKVKVKATREKGFKGDIALTYEGAKEAGVAVEGGDKIAADKDEVEVTLKGDEKEVKGGKVKVTGKGEKADDGTTEIDVTPKK